jgi:hypothetical protein
MSRLCGCAVGVFGPSGTCGRCGGAPDFIVPPGLPPKPPIDVRVGTGHPHDLPVPTPSEQLTEQDVRRIARKEAEDVVAKTIERMVHDVERGRDPRG